MVFIEAKNKFFPINTNNNNFNALNEYEKLISLNYKYTSNFINF